MNLEIQTFIDIKDIIAIGLLLLIGVVFGIIYSINYIREKIKNWLKK